MRDCCPCDRSCGDETERRVGGEGSRRVECALVDQFTDGLAFWRSSGLGTAPLAAVGMPVLECIATAINRVPQEVPWSYLWVAIEEMHFNLVGNAYFACKLP